VEVFTDKSEKDLKGGGRKWIESAFGHRCSIIAISKNDYRRAWLD
jgi:hypothetical protein